MDKFKVGDRVRAMNSVMVPKGSVGTVGARCFALAEPHVHVIFDDPAVQGSETPWLLRESSLEFITPPVLGRVLKDDGSREQYPLYDGLFAYFPAALCEVARWSVVGNNKHNPGEPLHWARDKSTDHENKILRHLLDARQVDKDGFVEAVALVWRSLALCQTILEERGWTEGPNARRNGSAS